MSQKLYRIAVLCVAAAGAATTLFAQYPKGGGGVVNSVVIVAPASDPPGAAQLVYSAFRKGADYCVEPRIVVAPRRQGAGWPSWSRAFVLDLVDARGRLVNPDSTVNVPQAIPNPSSTPAPTNGPVVLASLAQWCAPAAKAPTWFLRVDQRRQLVKFAPVAPTE